MHNSVDAVEQRDFGRTTIFFVFRSRILPWFDERRGNVNVWRTRQFEKKTINNNSSILFIDFSSIQRSRAQHMSATLTRKLVCTLTSWNFAAAKTLESISNDCIYRFIVRFSYKLFHNALMAKSLDAQELVRCVNATYKCPSFRDSGYFTCSQNSFSDMDNNNIGLQVISKNHHRPKAFGCIDHILVFPEL